MYTQLQYIIIINTYVTLKKKTTIASRRTFRFILAKHAIRVKRLKNRRKYVIYLYVLYSHYAAHIIINNDDVARAESILNFVSLQQLCKLEFCFVTYTKDPRIKIIKRLNFTLRRFSTLRHRLSATYLITFTLVS